MGRKSVFTTYEWDYAKASMVLLERLAEKKADEAGNALPFLKNGRARAAWFKNQAITLLQLTKKGLLDKMTSEHINYLINKAWTTYKKVTAAEMLKAPSIKEYVGQLEERVLKMGLEISYNKTLLPLQLLNETPPKKAGQKALEKRPRGRPRKQGALTPLASPLDEQRKQPDEQNKDISLNNLINIPNSKAEGLALQRSLDEQQNSESITPSSISAEGVSAALNENVLHKSKKKKTTLKKLEVIIPEVMGPDNTIKAKADNAIVLNNRVKGRYRVSDANTTWYTDWVTREDFTFILVIDAASKAILGSVVYRRTPSASEYLSLLMDLIAQYVKPRKIHSDGGGCYVAKVVINYLKSEGIIHSIGLKENISFQNQVMEAVNSKLVRYLSIEHKNVVGLMDFKKRNIRDKTWLVKAAVSHYNDVPVGKASLASPYEFYEWLINQPIKLNIETNSTTEDSARVQLWHDFGSYTIAIKRQGMMLSQYGVDATQQVNEALNGFVFTGGVEISPLKKAVEALKTFLMGLKAQQEELVRLTEAQTSIAESRHAESMTQALKM